MKQYTSLYFVGAGGIGMSALVRYFWRRDIKSRVMIARSHL